MHHFLGVHANTTGALHEAISSNIEYLRTHCGYIRLYLAIKGQHTAVKTCKY